MKLIRNSKLADYKKKSLLTVIPRLLKAADPLMPKYIDVRIGRVINSIKVQELEEKKIIYRTLNVNSGNCVRYVICTFHFPEIKSRLCPLSGL